MLSGGRRASEGFGWAVASSRERQQPNECWSCSLSRSESFTLSQTPTRFSTMWFFPHSDYAGKMLWWENSLSLSRSLRKKPSCAAPIWYPSPGRRQIFSPFDASSLRCCWRNCKMDQFWDIFRSLEEHRQQQHSSFHRSTMRKKKSRMKMKDCERSFFLRDGGSTTCSAEHCLLLCFFAENHPESEFANGKILAWSCSLLLDERENEIFGAQWSEKMCIHTRIERFVKRWECNSTAAMTNAIIGFFVSMRVEKSNKQRWTSIVNQIFTPS